MSAPTPRKRVLLPVPMIHPCGPALLAEEVDVVDGSRRPAADAPETLRGVHGVYSQPGIPEPWACSDEAQMRRAPKLLVIGVSASGFDWIDVAAATRLGIAVVHAAGAQYKAVAEHAVGLMLSLAKRIGCADRMLRAGGFVSRDVFSGSGWPGFPHEIEGATLGVLGYGFIGRDLAHKCRTAFGMQVLAYDPYFDPAEAERQGVELVRQRERLPELLARCDFVCLCLPLGEETRQLIGEPELRCMRPTAHLINVSRGGTVDEAALTRALREGWIAGAGLDVFDPEPTRDDHPFFSMAHTVLTPHIGGWVEEALPRLAATTAREMLAVLRGERPARLANPEVWPAVLERLRAEA